jgi:hypothetical protein
MLYGRHKYSNQELTTLSAWALFHIQTSSKTGGFAWNAVHSSWSDCVTVVLVYRTEGSKAVFVAEQIFPYHLRWAGINNMPKRRNRAQLKIINISAVAAGVKQ